MKSRTSSLTIYFFLVFVLWLSSQGFSQESAQAKSFQNFLRSMQSPARLGEGRVVIQQDPRIADYAVRFNESFSKRKGVPGYRVRIFSASGRDARQKMVSENTRFIRLYENVMTYTQYDPPYWKIYVGDFYTRSEAEKFKQQIIGQFPRAFIRPVRLKVPDLND